jgi:hypothetical protein
VGETRTEPRLTDLHSDLTIEGHKGTREIIYRNLYKLPSASRSREINVKLCVLPFFLPKLAELLRQISKIDSTMESLRLITLMALFIVRLHGELLKHTRPVRKRTREIIYRTQAVVNLGPDPQCPFKFYVGEPAWYYINNLWVPILPLWGISLSQLLSISS